MNQIESNKNYEIDIAKLDLSNINEKEFYGNLREILKTARIEQNITQEQIARKLDFTRQQYQKYETGTNRLPAIQIVKICSHLGLNPIEVIHSSIIRTTRGVKNKPINEKTIINNHHHYNGFFSNFFNMDLRLMKNKIVVTMMTICLVLYFGVNIFKFLPEINGQYNTVMLRSQYVFSDILIAVMIFAVFGYSIFSYLFGYIAFYAFVNLIRLIVILPDNSIVNQNMMLKAGMQLSCILLTILTFYILKKFKVNIGVPVNKKEA